MGRKMILRFDQKMVHHLRSKDLLLFLLLSCSADYHRTLATIGESPKRETLKDQTSRQCPSAYDMVLCTNVW